MGTFPPGVNTMGGGGPERSPLAARVRSRCARRGVTRKRHAAAQREELSFFLGGGMRAMMRCSSSPRVKWMAEVPSDQGVFNRRSVVHLHRRRRRAEEGHFSRAGDRRRPKRQRSGASLRGSKWLSSAVPDVPHDRLHSWPTRRAEPAPTRRREIARVNILPRVAQFCRPQGGSVLPFFDNDPGPTVQRLAEHAPARARIRPER